MSSSASAASVGESKKCCEKITSNALLTWKNPIESGKVFGGSLVFLLFIKNVNLLTLLTRILYTVMFVTGSVEFVTNLVFGPGNGLITKYGIQQCPNTVGFIKPYVDEALKQLPVKQAAFRKLVFANSPKDTLMFSAVFYVLNKLFNLVSLSNLILIVDIALFTLPLVYKNFQTEIDAIVAQIVAILNKNLQKGLKVAQEKVEPICKQLEGKLKPLTKFINSKKNEFETTDNSASATASATGSAAAAEPASAGIDSTKEF